MTRKTIFWINLLALLIINLDISGRSLALKTESDLVLPYAFYKKFTGTIGDFPIVMDLIKRDTSFKAVYYYKRKGIPILMEGIIGTDNKFRLTLTDENLDVIEEFSGLFVTSERISGLWKSVPEKRQLKFSLKEASVGQADLSFDIRTIEYNRFIDGKEIANSRRTVTSFRTLDLFQVKSPETLATKRLNAAIEMLACKSALMDKEFSSLQEFLNPLNDEDNFEATIRSELITNENGVLCLVLCENQFVNHTYVHDHHYNFSIQTGNQISLDELFIPSYENDLLRIVNEELMDKSKTGCGFDIDVSVLKEDFAITAGGLAFYHLCENFGLGSQSQNVFITYQKISELINPNGFLAPWLNK